MKADSNTASQKFGDVEGDANQRPPVLDPAFDDPDLNGIGNAPANPIQLLSAIPSGVLIYLNAYNFHDILSVSFQQIKFKILMETSRSL